MPALDLEVLNLLRAGRLFLALADDGWREKGDCETEQR